MKSSPFLSVILGLTPLSPLFKSNHRDPHEENVISSRKRKTMAYCYDTNNFGKALGKRRSIIDMLSYCLKYGSVALQ